MPPTWSKFNIALTVVFTIAIVATLGAIFYLASTSHPKEAFTEFYILGPDGKAEEYPRVLRAGERGTVIVGIVNHERVRSSYLLRVMMGSDMLENAGPIIVANEEKWERAVSFTPKRVGVGQRVDFLLYKEGSSDPYLSLTLKLDVR